MSHKNTSLPFLVSPFPSFISRVLLVEHVGSGRLEETCSLGYVALGLAIQTDAVRSVGPCRWSLLLSRPRSSVPEGTGPQHPSPALADEYGATHEPPRPSH